MHFRATKVRDDFAAYLTFLADQKQITQDRILLKERKTRHRNSLGSSPITYLTLSGDKRFEAEISAENNNKYKFRVFADFFGEKPCFRFDSCGRAHCNPEDGNGLTARQVLTPHFHKFNNRGEEIAFHSELLKCPSDAEKIVRDHKSGIEHFCQEAKLTCSHKAYPELVLNQDTMDLSSDDPLNGVTF